MPKNINYITIIIITLESTGKIKTGKKNDKNTVVEEYFFHQPCKKITANTVMASRF